MRKLDPEFKKQWCAALRSGKFKQGRHTLRWIDRGRGGENVIALCCIGVGLVIKTGGDPAIGALVVTTENAADTIGLDDEGRQFCVGMNDDQELSFVEIAGKIEEHL